MAFAPSSFGSVHYRLQGSKDGLPIVFGNSLGTDLRIWDGVIGELADAYRLISFDQRGHGLSSVPPPPYDIGELSNDLLELADYLKLEKFALVGVSVGGLIALRFALDHPERVAALVLCDTAAKIGSAASWAARVDAVRSGGMAAVADAVLGNWFPQSIRAGRDAELAGWRNLLLSSPIEGYLGTCAALRDADLTDDIANVSPPTLVVVGAEDLTTPVALVAATAARLPSARFEVIEDAGHIPSIDQPKVLAGLISRHLEEAGYA